jgi:ATP-binding cassette, subfamily B, bacterial PglK
MLVNYGKLYDLLSPRERQRAMLLFGMILVMGLVEMTSVASILPFLAVLANPGIIETNASLAFLYDTLGFESRQGFLIFLGVGVFCIVVFGLLFKIATQYSLTRFGKMRIYSLSSHMLQNYLRQPYSWFLNRHSTDLGARILYDVDEVISGALLPAMRVVAQAVVVLFLVALLVAVQPAAALMVSLIVGGSYALIYLVVRSRLERIGQQRYEASEARLRISMEAIGGIKDVKLLGLEESYLRRFQKPARRLALVHTKSMVIGELPRHILEGVAFGGMLLLILFLLSTGDGTLESILPILGVYAFAGLRMFPALQQLYHQTTALRFATPTLENLHRDLVETRKNGRSLAHPNDAAIRLREVLEIDDVYYAYPQAERTTLSGLSLAIRANTTVGIVGGTGAGKTTAVDLILGLLEPQAGVLRVDGISITPDNLRAWQKSVGYVPQQIFLIDDTVAANIAFGIPEEEIDHAAVERAARTAEIHDFVMNELPQGYDTLVGEDGVRLSGGQRQRIGIARALYHDPDVLIMDEATSALDNITEQVVMDAVHNLGHAKTIVLIAHRLSTVRNCSTIFMLEHGELIASGSYDDLLNRNQKFRNMAQMTG